MKEPLLLVVDMQNGFINDKTEHIIPTIKKLLDARKWKRVVFTRFINRPNSGYVQWIHWSRFMGPPETDIISDLQPYADAIVDKHGYTAFVDGLAELVVTEKVATVCICGVATDGCVLKTAVDAFERGIEPVVVVDACASHAGPAVHDAGLLLLGRFIGKGQLRTAEEVLGSM